MDIMRKANAAKTLSAAITGFVTGKPVDASRTSMAGQVASQVTSTLRNTRSAQAALAAGTVAVGAKAAVIATAATAAAPAVAATAAVVAVGYGIKKMLR